MKAAPDASPEPRRVDPVLILLGVISLALWVELIQYETRARELVPELVARLGALSACWGLALLRLRKTAVDVRLILIFAVAFRVAAFFIPPYLENDFYRYLWEGKVLAAGLNPYLLAPDHEQLYFLRDFELWPWIGFAEVPAAYPPLVLVLFSWLSNAGTVGLKLVFLAGDLAVVGLLLKLLGVQRRWILVYAWCPLAVRESVSTMHFDVLVVAFLFGAFLLARRERWRWSYLVYALACAFKFFPLFLAPALYRKKAFHAWAVAGVLLTASYSPFLLSSGMETFTGLQAYAREWEFNSSLFALFAKVGGRQLASVANLVLTMAAMIYSVKLSRVRGCLLVLSVLLLTGPVLDPWYVLWILPFACLERSLTVLALAAVVNFSYLYFVDDHMSGAILLAQFVPVYGLGLLELSKLNRENPGERSH